MHWGRGGRPSHRCAVGSGTARRARLPGGHPAARRSAAFVVGSARRRDRDRAARARLCRRAQPDRRAALRRPRFGPAACFGARAGGGESRCHRRGGSDGRAGGERGQCDPSDRHARQLRPGRARARHQSRAARQQHHRRADRPRRHLGWQAPGVSARPRCRRPRASRFLSPTNRDPFRCRKRSRPRRRSASRSLSWRFRRRLCAGVRRDRGRAAGRTRCRLPPILRARPPADHRTRREAPVARHVRMARAGGGRRADDLQHQPAWPVPARGVVRRSAS